MFFTVELFARLLISTIVGVLSLWIAGKATHVEIGGGKIVVIAFLSQFLTPFIFTYLSSILNIIPFFPFIVRLFVWIGLVKFVVQDSSIIDAILLGGFAFGVSYFFNLIGLERIINNLMFG